MSFEFSASGLVGSVEGLVQRLLGGGPSGAGRSRPVQWVDTSRLLSDQARELINTAARQAAEWGSADIDAEHLLWAATQLEPARSMLSGADVDVNALARQLEESVGHDQREQGTPELTPAAKRALLDAHTQSREAGVTYIGPEHIVLGIASNRETPAGRALAAAVQPRGAQGTRGQRQSGQGRGEQPATPTLDEYGRDLTEAARQGRLDPVIGRESEVEQTLEVLSRRTKNNPVLVGDPGVGKTAIVEGIAQRIVNGDAPETLAGKRVVVLDLAGMVAGSQYRGEFEKRLKNVIGDVAAADRTVILFLDELHTLVGACWISDIQCRGDRAGLRTGWPGAWSPAGETVRNEPSTESGMAGQTKSSASSGRAGAATHGPQPPAHRAGHHGLPRLLPQFAAALRGELARNLGIHDSSWPLIALP